MTVAGLPATLTLTNEQKGKCNERECHHKNSSMKISNRRISDTSHSQPLFVMVSRFGTDSFPVRVRYLRLAQTTVGKTSSGISGLERRRTPQP